MRNTSRARQKTGQPVWKTDRPPIDVSSLNLKKSFVTPLIVNAAGRTQLISPGAHWVVSYDPATGKEFCGRATARVFPSAPVRFLATA